MYVTLNVEPYGTIQIMLLRNKRFLTLDDLTTAFINVWIEHCVTCSPMCCSTVGLQYWYIYIYIYSQQATVLVYIACQQALPSLRNFIITRF
jgi:hypothetical protein